MFLTIHGPLGHKDESVIDSQGLKLGALLHQCKGIEQVSINGHRDPDWQNCIPQKGTRIEVSASAGEPGTIIAIVGLALSLVMSGISYALTPKPKKPKLDQPQEAFGIAGFTNTTGRGTPAFVPYGLNRIFGHVISSGATVAPDGKQMFGKVLYFMGDMGGDGCGGISDIEIDKTAITQIPEIGVHFRSGTNDQPVIPEFENDDDLFSDGRTIDFDPDALPGTPLIYTTKGTSINRATLFFNFPGGLYRVGDTGKTRQAGVRYSIEISPAGAGTWTLLPNAGWMEQVKGGLFKTYEVNFPSAGQWDIRITAIIADAFNHGEQFVADAILFNVQETKFTSRRYPQWALLGLVNIPSKKFRSLEQLACSGLVSGKNCKVPNAVGGFDIGPTRQRCWIVRDMMTHPIVGMGSEIDESEIDDTQWRVESQDYYDEMVPGLPGQPMEVRDVCDYVMTESDWDWEHVKKVCGEARGRIIPSGDKWKYVVDKPGIPNLLYAEGANIIDGSLTIEMSRPDKPFSEVTAQFRDADEDYENNFSTPIVDPEAISPVQELLQYDTLTRESEVQRENLITFKRAFLERRRWSFLSPANAIVSEPLDLDYIAERTVGNVGAFSGILPAGSTATVIILPDIVTLETGAIYALIVKHKGDNTTEYRAVITPAGIRGSVTVALPYVQAPIEGDLFSLGKENIEQIITRAAELEIDDEGHVRQMRVEYVPAIYTQDPLPPKSVRRKFSLTDTRPPIPLRDAQVSEEVTINRDGSVRSILIFDVTPGLPQSSGVIRQAVPFVDRIAVGATEPPHHESYTGARFSVIAGTGIGAESRVVGYDGPNRVAFLSPNLPVPLDTTSTYTMTWERFADFGGFRVEMSDVGPDGPWSNLAVSKDTHWEMDGRGAGPGLVWFRFTPVSAIGIENAAGRPIRSILLQGDLSAPGAPTSVTISSYLLNVSVQVTMQRPVAEDFAGVEIEVWRHAIGTGVLLRVNRFGAPTDTAASGEMRVEGSFNLSLESYGTVIQARARSVDFSVNYSAFVNSGTITLTPDPGSAGLGVGPPAIPTGLTVFTGVQIDPFDGQTKPFLDISWNANTEPDMAQYEVQYRRVEAIPVPVTARMVGHLPSPQLSIREIGVIGGVAYQARIQAIDTGGNKSGFSAFVGISSVDGLTARDSTPPLAPGAYDYRGGFKLISIFFNPPNTPDLAGTEVWLSTVNDLSTAFNWGEAPRTSIQFIASRLENDVQYYIWMRSFDYSGNRGPYDRSQFDGYPVRTLKIDGNDVITTSALITNFAQIQTGIISNAHISNLSANKITTGLFNAQQIGVGPNFNVQIDGINRVFAVIDENIISRVQIGKLGPSITDYGMQVYGHDGSLWYDFTEGARTEGRQNVNSATFAVSQGGANADRSNFCGVFVSANTTTQIIVRVANFWVNTPGGKTGVNEVGVSSVDYTLTHNKGKRMMVTCGLTNIVEPDPPITATLQIDYW